MTTVGTVEAELREITGIKPKSKEGRQAYLQRLHKGLQDITDQKWEKMSEDAQVWANQASAAEDKGKEFPDFGPADEGGAKGDGKPKGNGKEPAPKKSAKSAEPKKAAKSETKSSGGSEVDGSGIKVRIKQILLKDPKTPVDTIMNKLSGKGQEAPSKFTVAGIRAEFRHSLKVLKQEGIKGLEHLEI